MTGGCLPPPSRPPPLLLTRTPECQVLRGHHQTLSCTWLRVLSPVLLPGEMLQAPPLSFQPFWGHRPAPGIGLHKGLVGLWGGVFMGLNSKKEKTGEPRPPSAPDPALCSVLPMSPHLIVTLAARSGTCSHCNGDAKAQRRQASGARARGSRCTQAVGCRGTGTDWGHWCLPSGKDGPGECCGEMFTRPPQEKGPLNTFLY